MYTLFTTTALLAATATASMQKWDTSCGSKYDRISTETLTMTSADNKFAAGSLVTVDSSGVTNLHGPFMGGSWSVRVYEEGASKPVGDFFGDLSKVLTFPDAKNTSFKIDGLTFALPEQQYSGKFQASFTATDFSHATYFCVDIFYGLDNAATVGAPNLLAAPQLVLPTFAPNQDPYTVTTQPGNFTVSSVQMTTRNGKFEPHYVATVVVKGVCEAEIDAGAVKYQMYETGVTSFIASGNSPYFTCDNKGCDPTSGIALKYTSGTMGDFVLSVTLALPAKAGNSNDFKLVMWGEDQDHNPYDFSATVNFAYTATINAVHTKINALAAKQLQIHHDNDNGGDGPNAHCMEMTVTAPSTNTYWQAHGYQYPIQLWPKGPCDHKKYNFFNRKTDIATGVSMVTLGEHTDGGAMQLQDASTVNDVDCSDNKCLYLITNPTSPSGKQHCQELDNPEGTKGGYWASKGWKYTSPPWTQGKCDRNLFNFVNRETQDLDGFKGVTFWYLGIQH